MDRAGVLRLASSPDFRALWIGQLISIVGDRLHYLALLALVVERARDPGNPAPELAIIPVVSFLPAILFGPMAGALVDRWDTRRVLIASDAVRGAMVLLMIPAALWGGLPAAFAVVFALYVVNSFFLPARSAILPDLVPPAFLVQANSLATLAGVLATLIGSLLGGFLVERVGWRWGFLLDAGTYFASVAALATIRSTGGRATPRRTTLGDAYRTLGERIAEGARIAFTRRPVLGSLAALALLWAAGGALHVAGTLLVRERTPGMVAGVGMLLTAAGAGMAVGTALLATRGNRLRPSALLPGALAGIGAALVAFGVARSVPALCGAAGVAGFCVAILLVTAEATIQRTVSAEARGRVFALRDVLTRLTVLGSAGLVGWGLSRRWIGPEAAVLGSGALLVACAAAGFAASRRAATAPRH